jgi:murein DD-endopeptidase MepM/ murein hydrolase activator NlpD
MTKGIGPVSDDEELPDARKLQISKKYDLTLSDGEVDSKVAFSDLELKMGDLNETIASVEMRLQQVYEFHKGKLAYWAAIPSIWPCRGWVTSEFGVRRSPRGIGTRFHEGIDIAASTGTPIYASGDGVVTFAGYKHGLGKTVIIDHGFGISTVYGHNSSLYVKEGDTIKRGSSIAAVGRTGRSTGPHLHYQVEVDGVPVDPMRYIIESF